MKSVKFITLGCKANQYDTQDIRERLLEAGLKEVGDRRKADIYIINTCTVTHKADRESLYHIHRSHRENPHAQIIVTGCLTELDEDKIKNIGGITLILKNRDKEKILNYLVCYNSRTHELANSRTNQGISYFAGHTRAFLKIQDGCNNSCSYCKVCLVRGKSRSKPIDEVIDEAKRLAESGYKEIVLTGICLGAYGKDLKLKKDLVDVIEAIEKINGLLRIRLSSIEAADVSDRLIRKIGGSNKLCRHLHIPIQSGDDKILKKMKRNYSHQDYLNLIQRIKQGIPEIGITTDILVGFPGESEDNFQNTVKLIQEIIPLRVHIFAYSPREYTPACNFPERVKPEVVKRRFIKLKEIAQKCTYIYQKKFLGKKIEVLIEDRLKENPVFWEGYTNNYIKVLVKSEQNLKNQLISLRLNRIVKDCVLTDFC
jgi:threonylcarbamoyladenosine tRNA methylthiotransferase MtaB